MSGSPKYSYVLLEAMLSAARDQARAQRVEQRRQRDRDLARLAGQRAAQRAADRADERRGSTLERLGPLRELAEQVRGAAGFAALERSLGALVSAVESGRATDHDQTMREAERIRAGLLGLRVTPDGRAEQRARAVADLRTRLADVDADGRAELAGVEAGCSALIVRLEQLAADSNPGFEVLLGTAEHDVAAFLRRAADTGERARAAQRDRDELTERWAALEERAQAVLRDANDFDAKELAQELEQRLAEIAAAAEGGRLAEALAALNALAQWLDSAEAELDELAVAAQQCTDLAAALRQAMEHQGMLFLDGEDLGNRLILRFQRVNGAVYTTAVDAWSSTRTAADDAQADAVISYHVEGEPDVEHAALTGSANCDHVEEFLGVVHGELAEFGFRAGEVHWEGKPPRDSARQLPAAQSTEVRHGAAPATPPARSRGADR
ncbi:MAG TPA: hypothetical protein VL551_08925 [Actinospica sp.]|jgi:hypothetical protein|nr:hypothetical protein [Actinospica sp.]